jgi:diguanylate cyclase (GGDEF)-like protein/PAS domain S-box-containing protein
MIDSPKSPQEEVCSFFEQQQTDTSAQLSQIEAGLRRNQAELEWYRLLWESIPSIYLIVDQTGVICYISRFASNCLGYKSEELVQRSIFSLVDPQDWVAFETGIISNTKTLFESWESRLVRKDGSILWVKIKARHISHSNRNIVVLVGEDIGDRKQIEVSWKRMQAKLSDILDSAIAAIASLKVFANKQFEYEYQSAGSEVVFGYTPTELMADQKLWASRVVPEDLKTAILPAFEDILAGRSTTVEYRFYDKNGKLRWISSTFTPRRQEGSDYWIVTSVASDISGRKNAEAALCKSEEELQLVMEATVDGIWDWDIVSNTWCWSKQAYQMLGLPPTAKEVNASPSILQRIHPEDQQRFAECVQNHLKFNTPYAIEVRIQRGDGSYGWFLSQGKALRVRTGNPIRMVGSTIDITARKQAEEKLRKSETFLAAAQRVAHIGNWEFDLASQKITWSQELFRIFGLDPKQGEPNYEELIHLYDRDSRKKFQLLILQAIATGEPYESELKIVLPSGEIKYIEAKGEAVVDGQGRVISLFGTAQDISDRKISEAALRDSEERFRQLAEHIREIFYLQDAIDARMLYISPAYEQVWGRPCTELYANLNVWIESVVEADRDRVKKVLVVDDWNTNQIEAEYRIQRPDNSIRWIRARAFPIYNDRGKVYRIAGIAEDITERKYGETIEHQLIESLRQQAELQRLVGAITQRIRQSLNLDEILNTTVAEVRQFLQTDRVIIYRFEPDGSGTVIVESVDPVWVSILGRKIEDNCLSAAQCLQSYTKGRIHGITDIYSAEIDGCYVNLLASFQVKANLVVPILQGENLWGLLVAQHCANPRQWQVLEIDLLQQLATSVGIAIQQSELYQQLQIANLELQRQATLDGLTQLANRRRFDEYLNTEWLRHKREQLPLSLILFDADYFKLYNDTYGHLAGDDCLRQMASAIAAIARRPADLVARYGGEEFAVVLPNTDANGAMHIASTIRLAVRQLAIPHSRSSTSDRVTVSLGVAGVVPTKTLSPQDLLNAADQALYTAKQLGRDRYCIFPVTNTEKRS